MRFSLKDRLRLAWGAHLRRRLRRVSRPYDAGAASALVISPHPDDESLGCGGLIAAKVRAGQCVDVVFLTAGEASHPGHPRINSAALGALRREEARAALATLGVGPEQAHFWDLPDGRLDQLLQPGFPPSRLPLTDLIRQTRPGEVFAPYQGGGSTEHTAAHLLAWTALEAAGGGRLMEYPVWAWWKPSRLAARLAGPNRPGNWRLPLGELLELKRRALACHRTQVEPTPPWTEPVLPPVLGAACCGPEEFFFSRDVPAAG